MKILCIGAGSMGRRRLRDLLYLKAGDILLYEPAEERCREIAEAFGVRGFTDLEAALAEEPSAMTVSTPPALHEHYVRLAMERNLHVFAEVPFVLDVRALEEIAKQAASYPGVLGVSHTLSYYPPIRLIDDLMREGVLGKPLYLEYSLGNYLPDWHPYEDYRTFYGSDAQLGGAGLDMLPHDLGPVQWWMGDIESVCARLRKLSSLDIKGPDTHDALLSFVSGAGGFFHNDILEQGTTGRHVRIVGEEGTLEWHQKLATVRVYHHREHHEIAVSEASDWAEALESSREVAEALALQRARSGHVPPDAAVGFAYESCYLREMKHFVEAMEGRQPFAMCTVEEELQTMKVVDAILRSSEEGKWITVSS